MSTEIDTVINTVTHALRHLLNDEEILEVSARNDSDYVVLRIENLQINYEQGTVERAYTPIEQ